MKKKICTGLCLLFVILFLIGLPTGFFVFLVKHNEYKRTEAYKEIPTYKEVAIDYMGMNNFGRDSEKYIRINRHYKANDATLVYCGQNTIDFRNFISFNSIYVFESKQIEMFVVYEWVYKGSYEV